MTRVVATAGVFLLTGLAAGQAPDGATVRGDSPQTLKRLAELQKQIGAGKIAEVADELQRVLDDGGDDLIAIQPHWYVPARRYAHQFLAQLPPAALSSYRDRIDTPAAKLLARGRAARDPQPLRQLLDKYFVSRPAEEALLLLGELAFERGEYRRAEGYWRQLLPAAEGDEVAFPGPRTDAATVRAKLGLLAVFRHDSERAKVLIKTIREKHAAATGRLAGRTGNYADILQGLLAHPPQLSPPADGAWTTLGGDPARDGRADGLFSYHWSTAPTWATSIPKEAAADRDSYPARLAPTGSARSVAFHPVVIGDRAFLADAGRVIAFDLATGAAEVVYDIRREDPFSLPGGDLKLPIRYDADFSLTANGPTLYARLGPASLFPNTPPGRQPVKRTSFLVCLDVTGAGVKHRWSKAPPAASAAWEGAPVVADDRVIAAFAKSDGGRIVHALACYDESGRRLLWSTDLCESAAGPLAEIRRRQELVTLAGPNAVFCSQTGVVAAVDARSGKPTWAFRYPTAKSAGERRYRDISPPVAADGRVFVAPTDGEFLAALDAETGRVLWRRGPFDVEQLVGVAGGKVVCTIAGPTRGVRAFDAATGSTDQPHGWSVHDDPYLASFGRGLLTDDYFVWPTDYGLYVLRLRDGTLARQPILGPQGNLAIANGVLLCATPTELRGFVLPTRKQSVNGTAGPRWAREPEPEPPTVSQLTSHVRPESPTEPTEVEPRLSVPPTVSTQSPPVVPALPPGIVPISSVVRTESRVVARIGDYHIVALDPRGGRTLWVIDALKRSQFVPFAEWPTRRFLPPLYADEGHVVVFTGYGRRWVIDAESGGVVFDQPGPPPEYVSAVVAVAPNRLAAAAGAGRVAVFDPTTGVTEWEYDAGRHASLMGTAPRVWAAGNSVFVAVARNTGVEIDRLRPADGRSVWREGPVFVPSVAFDPAATCCNRASLFLPIGTRLFAFRLASGRPAWVTDLPGTARWAVHATANAVVAVPQEALAAEPFAAVAARVGEAFVRRVDARRLPGLSATLYDAWTDRTVPVLLFDPATGRRLHRLDLPAYGPAVAVRTSPDGLTVLTGKAAYRLK